MAKAGVIPSSPDQAGSGPPLPPKLIPPANPEASYDMTESPPPLSLLDQRREAEMEAGRKNLVKVSGRTSAEQRAGVDTARASVR